MTHKNLKKLLALLLALTMCFSLLPVSAFAGEPEGEITVEDSQDPPAPDEDEVCEHEPAEAVTENEVAPTCTAPGSHDEVVYCALCEAELSRKTVEDPALGHNYEAVEAVEPTCTEPGHTAGVVCTRCGDVESGYEESAALGHTPEDVEEIPAEVGKPGVTAGVVCAVCGEVLEGCEEIEALEEEEVEKAALTVREPTGNEAAQTVELTLQDTQKTMLLGAPRGTGVIDSGFCGNPSVNGGEDVTWVLYTDGLFTISGAGKMADYSSSRDVPWKNYRSSILSLSIADGILSVGDYAFGSCTALAEISLPTSVKSIGKGAFGGCTALTDEKFSIPTGVESISSFAFGGCNGLTSIVIPDGVKSIDEGAFAESSGLTSVVIPASATSFGGNPFWGCEGLKTVGPIGSGCNIEFGWEEEIPDSAFSISSTDFCTQESILLPATLKRIGSGAFWNCGTLSELAIPGGVTSIGSGAFCGCHSIESLTIPSGVTVIEEDTFRNCTSMENIWILGDVTSIGDNAFLNCTALKKVQLPQSVESIGESAFGNCYELESIKIPTSVESIGDDAFNTCTSLKTIRLPNNVTSIGQRAFLGCTSLKSAVLPLYLERIERNMFFACADLEWVYIPKNVTSIGGFAFNGCDALTTVYYEGTDTQWGILENNIEVVPYNGGTRDTSKTWLLSRNIVCNSSVPPEDDDCVYIVSTGDDPWTIDMEGSFESIVAETSSTQYNPKLAYCLAGLSRAVYKERDIRESMESLGFDYANAETMFKDDPEHFVSGYAIAKKELKGDKTLVLVVIRGSVGYNWNNLLLLRKNTWEGNGLYDALELDTAVVHLALKKLLGGSIPNTDDMIYVITGHSQGAGAANVLTKVLRDEDQVPLSNIYDYNFACLNVGSYTDERIWDLGGRYDCIFNIGNIEDPVTLLPNTELLTVVYELFEIYLGQIYKSPPNPDATWWKYGNSYWFVPHEGNRAGSDEAWAGHDMLFYLRHLSNQYPLEYYFTYSQIEEYKPNLWWKLFATLCPVDMVVYGKDGNPIAGVTNDQANCYDPNSTVMIFTAGDRKCIFLPADQEYDVRMTGTDSGEMTFRIMDVNLADGEVLAEKDFISVPLTLGKVMTSSVGGETSVKAARLLVLDEQENPIREVKEDGTEILYLADPAKKPTSLTMDREYLALKQTDTTQELSVTNLPEKWLPYLEWSSDNTSVVKVTKTGEGEGKLTPDPEEKGAEGTAWITATVDTGEGVLSARCRVDVVDENEQTLTEQARVNGVRLPVTKATVELYKLDYAELPVELVLTQNLTAQANSTSANENTAPAAPTDNGAAIEQAEFVDEATKAVFDLRVKDDRTLLIVPKDEYVTTDAAKLKTLKGSYKSAVRVWIEGTPFETNAKTPLTVTVRKSLPNIKAAAVKLNSYIIGDTRPITITGGTVTGLAVDSSKKGNITWAELNNDGTLTYTGVQNKGMSGKLNLLVSVDGWAVSRALAVSVSASNLIPKLTFKPTSLTLKPGTLDAASTAITVSPVNYAESEITVTRITEGSGKTLQNYGNGSVLDCVVDGRVLTVRPVAGFNDTAAHTYKVYLGIEGREYAVTVKTLPAKTAVTLAVKAAGFIDTALKNSSITLTATPKNFHAGSGESYSVRVTQYNAKTREEIDVSNLLDIEYSGNVIRLTESTPGSLPSGYTYNAYTKANVGGVETPEVKTKLNVKWSVPAKVKPSVTLKVTGFIDVVRPGSTVTVTPTVKNCYTYVPDKADLHIWKQNGKAFEDITGTARNPFDVSVENGAFVLRQSGFIDHRTDKFKVSLSAEMDGQSVNSAQAAVTVKMNAVKLAQSVKAVTLSAKDRNDRATVRLTPAAGLSEIAHVVLISPKDKSKREVFALTELGNGEYAICYNGSQLPNGFTSGTVKLQVYLEGNASYGTAKPVPNATMSVSVKLL